MVNSELFLSDHGVSTVRDFGFLFCGKKLGAGIGREVYELVTDKTKVVKIETGNKSFQNVIEWETWCALAKKHQRWLAPCRFISPSGIILIQDRTEPLREADIPKRIPEWLADCKYENYGMLDGRFVCHDYGLNLLLNHGAFSGKLTTRKWVK